MQPSYASDSFWHTAHSRAAGPRAVPHRDSTGCWDPCAGSFGAVAISEYRPWRCLRVLPHALFFTLRAPKVTCAVHDAGLRWQTDLQTAPTPLRGLHTAPNKELGDSVNLQATAQSVRYSCGLSIPCPTPALHWHRTAVRGLLQAASCSMWTSAPDRCCYRHVRMYLKTEAVMSGLQSANGLCA